MWLFVLLCFFSPMDASLPPNSCSFANLTHGDPLVIGLIAPINISTQGDFAVVGQELMIGIAAAIAESNEEYGPMCGNHNLSLVWEDMSFFDPSTVPVSTIKLLDRASPLVIISTPGTDPNIVQAPILRKKQVVSVGAITGASEIRVPFDPYFVNIRPSYNDELAALVHYFVDILGLFRIGLVYDHTEFGRDVRSSLITILRERRLPIYVERKFNSMNPDPLEMFVDIKQSLLDNRRIYAPQVFVLAAVNESPLSFVSVVNQEWPNMLYSTLSVIGVDMFYHIFPNNPEIYTRAYSVTILPNEIDTDIPIVASFHKSLERLRNTTYENNILGLIPHPFAFESYIATRLWIEMIKFAETDSIARLMRGRPQEPITTEKILDVFYNKGMVSIEGIRLGPYGGKCEFNGAGCECNQGIRSLNIAKLNHNSPRPVIVPEGLFTLHSCGYQPRQPKTIYFGQSAVIDPLTQPQIFQYGLSMRMGILAAFAQVNLLGGVQGFELDLITYNDDFDPAIAYNNSLKLLEDDRVFGLIGYLGTPSSLSVLKLLNHYGVPLIGPFTGAMSLRRPFDHHVINTRASYEDEIGSLLRILVDNQRFSRIMILYQSDEFGLAGKSALENTLSARRIPILALESFSLNLGDHVQKLNSMVTQVEEKNVGEPQVLFVVSSTGVAIEVCAEAQRIWPEIRIALGSYVDFDALLYNLRAINAASNGNPINFENYIWATKVFPPIKSDDNSDFAANLRNALRLVNDSVTGQSGLDMSITDPILVEGYIAGRLTILAMERLSRSTTPDQFIDAVYNTGIFPIDDFVRLGPYGPNCSDISSGCQCNQGMRRVMVATTDNAGNVLDLPNEEVRFTTCGYVDNFRPVPCRESYWSYSVSECDASTQLRTVDYEWNAPHPWFPHFSFECVGGSSLPEDLTFGCEIIMPNSKVAIAIKIGSIIGICFLSILIFGIIYFRKERIMVNSQWRFLILMLIGGIVSIAADFTRFGLPNNLNCTYYHIIRTLGSFLLFSSLYARTARVRKIFDNPKLRKVVIKDQELLLIVAQIMTVVVGLLFGFIFFDSPKPKLDGKVEMLFGEVPHVSCEIESYVFMTIINALLIYLVVMAGYNSYRIRKAPQEFQESKHLALASYNIAMCTTFAIPFTASGTVDTETTALVETILNRIAIIGSLLILIGPKFFTLHSTIFPTKYTDGENSSDEHAQPNRASVPHSSTINQAMPSHVQNGQVPARTSTDQAKVPLRNSSGNQQVNASG